MRIALLVLAGLLILTLVTVLGCEMEPATPTPMPTLVRMEPVGIPTVTPSLHPEEEPTPTLEESLRTLIQCERVKANKSMGWGQGPGVVYSDDPRVTGRIQSGDYVRFLSVPNADGLVRVQVYPHDYRTVGQTDGKVWIDWGSLELFRLDLDVFTCEN